MLKFMVLVTLLSCCTALFIRKTLVVVTVLYDSMSPTLNDGDRVLVLRYWPSAWLRRGMIVVVWPWNSNKKQTLLSPEIEPFIKRIIGLPGDRLVTASNELDEYNRAQQLNQHDANGRRIWNISSGKIFVRGDHPIGGHDSLSWGPIPFDSVLGIVIKRLPREVIA